MTTDKNSSGPGDEPEPQTGTVPAMASTETRTLPCRLTDAEMDTRRRQVSLLLSKKLKLEAEAKDTAAEYKRQVKEIDGEIIDKNRAALAGAEQRPVRCQWIGRGAQRELIREDTGEVVEVEALTVDQVKAANRQPPLPFDKPEAPAPAPAPTETPAASEAPAAEASAPAPEPLLPRELLDPHRGAPEPAPEPAPEVAPAGLLGPGPVVDGVFEEDPKPALPATSTPLALPPKRMPLKQAILDVVSAWTSWHSGSAICVAIAQRAFAREEAEPTFDEIHKAVDELCAEGLMLRGSSLAAGPFAPMTLAPEAPPPPKGPPKKAKKKAQKTPAKKAATRAPATVARKAKPKAKAFSAPIFHLAGVAPSPAPKSTDVVEKALLLAPCQAIGLTVFELLAATRDGNLPVSGSTTQVILADVAGALQAIKAEYVDTTPPTYRLRPGSGHDGAIVAAYYAAADTAVALTRGEDDPRRAVAQLLARLTRELRQDGETVHPEGLTLEQIRNALCPHDDVEADRYGVARLLEEATRAGHLHACSRLDDEDLWRATL